MLTVEREKHLFTVDEAQVFLGLSRAGIYRLIESGDLRRVKIGKSARIPRASLESFVDRLESQEND